MSELSPPPHVSLQATYTQVDGKKYDGDWIDGLMCGHGKYTYPDGEMYIGQWRDNQKHGHGMYLQRSG